ncbi:hypothetical protein N7528_008940 [Penicillium herquei]|nr:hypothetical protein N7528_008940 [Penicillium herquei]
MGDSEGEMEEETEVWIWDDYEDPITWYRRVHRPPKIVNPDNERMSALRRAPGKNGWRIVEGHDQFGGYYVSECKLDKKGNWKCSHVYDDYYTRKTWHTAFTNGSHFSINPDGSESWFQPGKKGWSRTRKDGPKTDWINPECPCFTSVNPPPRWWVTQNNIQVSEAQNALADRLDQKFGSPGFENFVPDARRENIEVIDERDEYDRDFEDNIGDFDHLDYPLQEPASSK